MHAHTLSLFLSLFLSHITNKKKIPGVRYGSWFFEVTVQKPEDMPGLPAAHLRIGWAQREGGCWRCAGCVHVYAPDCARACVRASLQKRWLFET